MKRFAVVPLDFDEGCALVERWHRHHPSPQGHKFTIGLWDQVSLRLVGVAIVGRPVSRIEQDGWTLEITRVATDGTRNAFSSLYAAARTAAFSLGWRRVITYNLESEGGYSLRGAGFACLGDRRGGSWDRRLRPRVDKHPTQTKIKWEARLA